MIVINVIDILYDFHIYFSSYHPATVFLTKELSQSILDV
jgi:hypothetical protein